MSSTNLSKQFTNAVAEKNIPYLRSYIASEIRADPMFKKNICDECMAYIRGKGLDITEPFRLDISEEPTPNERSKWDKRLFLGKVEYLRLNFAYDKRIAELKEIGKVAYASEAEPEVKADGQKTTFKVAPKGRRSKKQKTSPALVIGVIAAVAAIAAIIAFFLRK